MKLKRNSLKAPVFVSVSAAAGSSHRHVEQPDERCHHKVCPNLHQQSQVSRVRHQGTLSFTGSQNVQTLWTIVTDSEQFDRYCVFAAEVDFLSPFV